MKRSVSVLVTCDIDPTPEITMEEKSKALNISIDLFDRYKIMATFFIVANLVKRYQTGLHKLLRKGHQIGCHGLTHDEKEEYNRMPEHEIRNHLTRATQLIREGTGLPVRSFRGPRVKTSHVTQKVLGELGYSTDLSVCSQRIDFISSNLINPGWIFAPRLPYRPDKSSAFRRGKEKITVIPVSSLAVPFISSALYIFGLAFMKMMFKILYEESIRTGKPVVYITHPEEFGRKTITVDYKLSLKNVRSMGFSFRRRIKTLRSVDEKIRLSSELFSYMRKFRNVEFITVDEYVRSLKGSVRLIKVGS
jgi:hypothetical protein